MPEYTMTIQYCNWGDCDEIGTEPFVHRFLCKKHKKEVPTDLPGVPIQEDKKHHLCEYSGCRAYAVYRVHTQENPEELLFDSPETMKDVCAKHITTKPFVRSFGEIKHSRHMEQTKELKKEKEKTEIEDEKTESILFE